MLISKHVRTPALLRLAPATIRSIVSESFDGMANQYQTAHPLVDIVLELMAAGVIT